MRPEGPVARKSDYEIRLVPHREGARFIAQHHYARGTSNTAVAFVRAGKSRKRKFVFPLDEGCVCSQED